MAVTDEIKRSAGDLEQYKQWRSWMPFLTPIGYAYSRDGEPRRYYIHKNGRYYYIAVTEAEMHRME